MPEALDKVARELREAVLAADHASAERLVTEYRSALTEAWKDLSLSERVGSQLPEQANELLTWARGMTIVQRALLAEQLAVLDKAIRYASDRVPQRRSSIQVSL
jgi:hypothetical protein